MTDPRNKGLLVTSSLDCSLVALLPPLNQMDQDGAVQYTRSVIYNAHKRNAGKKGGSRAGQ